MPNAQAPNKSQVPNRNPQRRRLPHLSLGIGDSLGFGHWSFHSWGFFVVWSLVFGAFIRISFVIRNSSFVIHS
jgi:hypothetical protein